MTIENWLSSSFTELAVQKREQLLGALTPEEKSKLLRNDGASRERTGVIWPLVQQPNRTGDHRQ